jgi:hypothetical protein
LLYWESRITGINMMTIYISAEWLVIGAKYMLALLHYALRNIVKNGTWSSEKRWDDFGDAGSIWNSQCVHEKYSQPVKS